MNNIRTYQRIDPDGTFHARAIFDEPGSIDLTIHFADKPLTNGLPHIVGFAYLKSEREEGCVAAWDSDILDSGEGFIPTTD